MCCIQIFNQCNTKRTVQHDHRTSNSIEITEHSLSGNDNDHYASDINLNNYVVVSLNLI